MGLNLIKILFLLPTIFVSTFGFSMRIAEPYFPIAIIRLFKYGKFATQQNNAVLIPPKGIPKRWFKHFYVFTVPASTYILFVASLIYLGITTVPKHICIVLDTLFGADRTSLVSPEKTLLALILMSIHLWKRLYESHCVNVFSDVKISIAYYAMGYFHYVGTICCLVGESEGFVEGTVPMLNWNGLKWADYIAAIVFLWATYEQFCCNVILANLRKNEAGEVVTLSHTVPKGGLFDHLSAPLHSTEIIMYLMLTVVLWNSSSYHCVSFWVLINQTWSGMFSHWWYVDTFKDYPKQRKALIPYIL